jgi:PHP domain
MFEAVLNLHMHTRYSDGTGSHEDLVRAGLNSGLDALIVTDHNVLVHGVNRYVHEGGRKLLILAAEEVHDRGPNQQKNHMLVLAAGEELADRAANPGSLIDAAARSGGLTFIAHLHDPAAPAFHEPDISWEDWSAARFTGIELWNGFSELKARIPTKLHGIFYAYFPALLAHRPAREALQRWDQLLSEGRVVAIGGSDAHALTVRLGFLRRVVYPYEYHFRAINTHALLTAPLAGEAAQDAEALYGALAAGHCFIGYDLPAPTRGFRFTAHGPDARTIMGDEILTTGAVTLQAYLPDFAEIRLIRDGQVIEKVAHAQALTHLARQPGVYRVEAYRRYLGQRRGWIFSNPIYVR